MHRALALSLVVGALLMLAVQAAPGAARVSWQDISHTRNWRRSGKCFIVDMSFRNDKSFSLQDVLCPVTSMAIRRGRRTALTIRNGNHHQRGWL
jgi:hypothetical protein